MNLTVKMTGFDQLSLRVGYLKKAATQGLKDGVSEAAFLFETEAKQLVPVDTGALRDSIATKLTVDEAERQVREVAPDTPYAARIEFGFSGADSLGRVYHNVPQPYMRPAYETQKADAATAIKNGVRESVIEATNTVAARRNR